MFKPGFMFKPYFMFKPDFILKTPDKPPLAANMLTNRNTHYMFIEGLISLVWPCLGSCARAIAF